MNNEVILVKETVAEKAVQNGVYAIERSFIMITDEKPEDYYVVRFYGEYFNCTYSYDVMSGKWSECFGYLQSIQDELLITVTTTEEEFNDSYISTLMGDVVYYYSLT